MGFHFKERKLVGCDPDHVAVLVEDFFNRPRVTAMIPSAKVRAKSRVDVTESDCSSYLPFVRIPPIAYRCQLGAWILGEWMEIEPV